MSPGPRLIGWCDGGQCPYTLSGWTETVARLVTGIGFREPLTPALQHLHWLPVQYRITFKLCLLIYKFIINRHHHTSVIKLPQMPTCDPTPDMRSASTKKYQIPKTHTKFGEQSFFYAGSATWNTLLHYVREITDSVVFKRHLKSVLFRRTFLDSL